MSAPKKKHVKGNFKCLFCERSFSQLCDRNRHLQTHTQEKPFHCKFCNIEVANKSNLITHVIDVHYDKVKPTGKGKWKKYSNRIKSRSDRYCRNTCVFCCKQYLKKSVFEPHIRNHIDEKPYPCRKCRQAFASVKLLRRHCLRLHGRYEKLHKCGLCQKRYKELFSLTKHFRSKHFGKPLVYNTKIKRKEINEEKHTKSGPYECQECEKQFRCKYQIKIHYKSHHPEKQFAFKLINPALSRIMQTRHKCVFCAKGFSCLYNLHKHLRVEIGESPYFCQKCGQELKQTCRLRNHLYRTHQVLPKRLEGFNSHHEKPDRFTRMSCVFCNKFFPGRIQLDGHIRVHIHEKPYHCPYCPTGVTRKSVLLWHIQRFHPDKREVQTTAENGCKFNGDSSDETSSNEDGSDQGSRPANKNVQEKPSVVSEKCRMGACENCKSAVMKLPRKRYTYICSDPDPTDTEKPRCGRTFQCLYEMALHFRDDHHVPIFQNI